MEMRERERPPTGTIVICLRTEILLASPTTPSTDRQRLLHLYTGPTVIKKPKDVTLPCQRCRVSLHRALETRGRRGTLFVASCCAAASAYSARIKTEMARQLMIDTRMAA
jgi:hypothetical protein